MHNPIVPGPESIASLIVLVRGEKVMLSEDLAARYGVSTSALNQAFQRNIARCPEDFAFQLTRDEAEQVRSSRSQTVILERGQHIKYLPYAFTEQGVAMLSSVLRSARASRSTSRSCGPSRSSAG